jgi:regulator of sigma E protease
VTPGGAYDAGIRKGDTITRIDDTEIRVFDDLRDVVMSSEGRTMTFEVLRDGETMTFEVTPRPHTRTGEDGEAIQSWLIGVQGASAFGLGAAPERVGLAAALSHGTTGTVNVIGNSLSFIADIFRGRGDSADLGGPIRIAEVSGDAADDGFASLMRLTAILSASIGLINLFPIPVLDGGHLLFYAIEAVRGKPMSQRMQEIGLTIGLAMVVMLMVYATYNDVMRL